MRIGCKGIPVNKKYRIAVSIAIFLAVSYVGLTNYASDIARARIDAAVAKQGGKATYKKVFYNIFTQHAVISDVSIQPPGTAVPVNIDEIVVRRIDLVSPTPTYLSIDMRGMWFGTAILGNDGAAELAGLGYAVPFPLDIRLDIDCALDKREATIQSLYTAKDLGAVHLRLLFGDVDFQSADKVEKKPDVFTKITIKEAELVYVDASLAERIFKRMAANKGLDVLTFKKALGVQAGAFLPHSSAPHAADIAAALQQFINTPRRLTLSLTPAVPASLGEIFRAGSPEALAKLLNLQVHS